MNTVRKKPVTSLNNTSTEERREFPCGILFPSATKTKEVLLEELMAFFFEMENPQIQRITRHLLKKHRASLYNVSSSNAESVMITFQGSSIHVVSMLKLRQVDGRIVSVT